VATGLDRYAERNQPEAEVTSGLSAYLHWGQIGAHEVLRSVLASEPEWSPGRISDLCRGQREGWWGMSPAHEGFLDQLLTWRELGHNFVWHHADYERYESLPAWARTTLRAHQSDERPQLYSLAQFEAAATHDPIWNAAQRELVQTGRMHNYLRMLWGKKILHWSPSPQLALDTMITLNDRYALDGRDPNSYSGIGWVLGRFDRAWGPERAVFGKIRYMSSDSTRRKLRLHAYLQRFGPDSMAQV
jgi:deoxyribodipyrimidine photo-lyase